MYVREEEMLGDFNLVAMKANHQTAEFNSR